MANPFVWYDLMTPNIHAVATFYASAVGWTAVDSGLTDREYLLLSASGPSGSVMVAGLLATPEAMKGAPSVWNGHIGVDDVDAFASRVEAGGGTIHRAAEDIPNGIGRLAVVADPGGAVFILFQPGAMDQAPPPLPPAGTRGFIGWHELHAVDGGAAWEFYSSFFGWTKAEAVDMGAMGIYQTFAAGGPPIGGIMTKMPEMPLPMWLFYINVDSVSAAATRIADAGGKVIVEPRQIPGGSWIAQATDPQGALFAITSMTA